MPLLYPAFMRSNDLNAPISLAIPDRRGSGSFKWDLAGPEEIPMGVADMDYAVAPAITEALARRIEHPVFGYSGTPESYREALVAWEARRHDWTIDPSYIVTVPSVMPAIAVAIEMLTQPGDRIVTFSPVYFPFFEVIRELGREVVRVPLAESVPDGADSADIGEAAGSVPGPRYTFHPARLAEALDGAALFLLCSPHNPGGRVWTRKELETLRAEIDRAGVPVVADEIHADLTYPGETFVPWLTVGTEASPTPADGGAPGPSAGATRTDGGAPTIGEPPGGGAPASGALAFRADIALVAPSKTFNIPGLPLATAIIPEEALRERYRSALNARMLRLPNLLALTAAEAAYRGADAWLEEVRRAIHANYLTLRELLAPEPGVRVFAQEGTFIVWLDLRERLGYRAATPTGGTGGAGTATGAATAGAPVIGAPPPPDDSPSRRFGALAREHGVWLSPGRDFGPEGEGFMRINVATSRELLEEGVARLRRALAAHTR